MLQTRKEMKGANVSSGALYLWGEKIADVRDGGVVTLGEEMWETRVVSDEVLHLTKTTRLDNREAAHAEVVGNLANQVAHRRMEVRALDKSIAVLLAKVAKGDEKADEIGKELVQELAAQGKHKRSITELEERNEVAVEVDVVTETTSFELKAGFFSTLPALGKPVMWCVPVRQQYSTERTTERLALPLKLPADKLKSADIQGTLVRNIGSHGTGDGQFYNPEGIAVDGENLYVVDNSNHRIQVFTKEGAFVRRFGSHGTGDGQFYNPEGIAVDGENLYVADSYNHRIQVFTKEGAFVRKIGSKGTGDGQCSCPRGVAVDGEHIYVADCRNNRIQVFTKEGAFVRHIGSQGTGDGQCYCPIGTAVDGEHLYVADYHNNRIQVFTKRGAFVREIGSQGTGHVGVAVNGEHLYVADGSNHSIQVFTKEGAFVRKFGSQGTGDGQFSDPGGIAFDGEHLYVADHGNHRILMLR